MQQLYTSNSQTPGFHVSVLIDFSRAERCLTLDVNNNEAAVPMSSIISPSAGLSRPVRGAPSLPGVWRHTHKASAAWESRGRLGNGSVYRYTGELRGAEVVGTTHSAHAPVSDNPTKHAQNTHPPTLSLSHTPVSAVKAATSGGSSPIQQTLALCRLCVDQTWCSSLRSIADKITFLCGCALPDFTLINQIEKSKLSGW